MRSFKTYTAKALPAFSRNRSCPKCGGAFIETKYDSERDIMVRKCSACGHVWHEAPLDRKEAN